MNYKELKADPKYIELDYVKEAETEKAICFKVIKEQLENGSISQSIWYPKSLLKKVIESGEEIYFASLWFHNKSLNNA